MTKIDKTIYFDMDGTIADLYGVDNWLSKLRAEDKTPYAEAEPLVDVAEFTMALNYLQGIGYKLGIISWLSKDSSDFYKKEVRATKLEWLNDKFPEIKFDEIHIVQYGYRKDYVANDKMGMLFDDSKEVREKWRGTAYDVDNVDIMTILNKLIEVVS